MTTKNFVIELSTQYGKAGSWRRWHDNTEFFTETEAKDIVKKELLSKEKLAAFDAIRVQNGGERMHNTESFVVRARLATDEDHQKPPQPKEPEKELTVLEWRGKK